MADIAVASGATIEVLQDVLSVKSIAGVAISAGDVCRLATTGKWAKARGNAAGTADIMGVAMRTVVAGEALTCLVIGVMAGWDLASQAFGEMVFLSDTDSGVIGDAAGTAAVQVGQVIPTLADGVSLSDKAILINLVRSATTAP